MCTQEFILELKDWLMLALITSPLYLVQELHILFGQLILSKDWVLRSFTAPAQFGYGGWRAEELLWRQQRTVNVKLAGI